MTVDKKKKGESLDKKAVGFGTFKGVYIPNVLMMLGVILYLRLGYVTAQVGPLSMTAILGLSLFIMVVTCFSITSIVTNMRMGGGGAYYMISRSLGIELGAAVGILMYLSQIISIAMCTSGFALSFHELYPQFAVDEICLVTVSILTLVALISSDLTLKTQTLIFVVISASLVSVFTGSIDNITRPLVADDQASMGFWEGFAIFFPAVTGIEAGMAMSGSLKNPARSLPLGAFGALATCGLIYSALAFFLSYKIPAPLMIANPLILQEFAAVRELIILGIWGATLSSALGGLLGAPRMLQALANDRVLPKIFARMHGKNAEPRYALMFSACASLVLLLTTQMDQIIPILTMVCLISYGILNFVAGFADLIHHPSWRPTFKTPWYMSFTGATACFTVMLMVDAGSTLISLVLVLVLYVWVKGKNIKVHFEDVRETIFFYFARKVLYRLSDSLQHAKNWHLNLLAFVPSPRSRMDFVHLAAGLTHRTGVLTFTSFLPEAWRHEYRLEASEKTLNEFFAKQKIPCLVEVSATDRLHASMASFIESYGIGPLQPNMIALSHHPAAGASMEGVIAVMRTAVAARKSVLVFRGEPSAGELGGVFAPSTGKERKQIDIWWDGDYRNNFSLMLYLAKVLMTSSAWPDAHLFIKTAVHDEATRDNIERYLRDFIATRRLNVGSEVLLVAEDRDAIEVLVENSRGSDLVLMGLKPLLVNGEEGEAAAASYAEYCEALTAKTERLRSVAFVLASGEVTFKDVFHE